MRRAWKFSLLLSLLLSCAGCDQITKSAARRLLSTSDPISLLNGLIRFEYAENPGGFLSIGASLPAAVRFLVFVVFTASVLVMMPLLAFKECDKHPTQLIGLALITGGGLGNLIDRTMNNGLVVDFASLGVGSLRTGIMNVADVAVFAGAVLFLYGSIRNKRFS
ncbi:MAG TPA: signal peptidase II [Pyrinomonadaceae bacterium]|nr:signal peptidase II [Pyrinomonadaceae bacterium]